MKPIIVGTVLAHKRSNTKWEVLNIRTVLGIDRATLALVEGEADRSIRVIKTPILQDLLKTPAKEGGWRRTRSAKHKASEIYETEVL